MVHPFALDPAGAPNDPWDRMADDIQRMQIGTEQFNKWVTMFLKDMHFHIIALGDCTGVHTLSSSRLNQERAAQLQANAQNMQRNQAKDLLGGIPYGDVPTAPRRGPGPEMMPTAGRKADMSE